jgi:hypothetical protein
MFNEGRFVERAEKGEIKAVLIHTGIPSPEVGLPLGSRSEMISYREINGLELARAHQYVLPDGGIGASGKPDPKRILKDGTLYRLEKKI